MDDAVTRAKNSIVRKIKFYKAKELSIPNFIRKAREDILENRSIPEDEQSVN